MKKSRIAIGITALVLCCFSGFSAEGGESYQFVAKWDYGTEPFNQPTGIAVDLSGNVLVADSKHDIIQAFDSSGKFLWKLGEYGHGDGQFAQPEDLALDSQGNMYVADSNNNRIQKFDSSQRFLTKWGSYSLGGPHGTFGFPGSVAVDSSGNVIVADSGNHRIQKFDSSGRFLLRWGRKGEQDGGLGWPCGIAVDSKGNVFLADTDNHRVQVFDSEGNYLRKWGKNGMGEGEFVKPHGITVDSNGKVYVADTENCRIQVFDSLGTFLSKWGSRGKGDGEFNKPQDVAVDTKGNVYVADTGNNQVQKFSPGGKKAVEARTEPRPSEEVKPAKAKKLTVENVVMLKELGLDDATILQKLSDTGTAFSAEEIEQLKEAGFSDEFLSKAQKPAGPAKRPKPTSEKGLVGSWHLKSAGLTVDLVLGGDGTFSWHYVGPDETEDLKGAWKKVDDATIEVQEEGDPTKSLMPCKLIDANTLQITVEGVILQFNRGK